MIHVLDEQNLIYNNQYISLVKTNKYSDCCYYSVHVNNDWVMYAFKPTIDKALLEFFTLKFVISDKTLANCINEYISTFYPELLLWP